jgi:hypothetical protein
MSAPQLRHQVAALQQAATAAGNVQEKASDEVRLEQFRTQLKQVQEDADSSADAEAEADAPQAAATASTGRLVDTTA